ncbi:hypothetical protein C8J56DRAFT_955625 [Mycena floridula]|nr:hypothetical protein C8J56DRAFT_955625 [Mycena floridula]
MSSSTSAQSSSRRSTMYPDTFRPRGLPLDPFGDLDQPWIVTLTADNPTKKVILALGELSNEQLSPIFKAHSLSNSLLILATHRPPKVQDPSRIQCSCRILRLLSPLAIEKSGALRLIGLFERASTIANEWRTSRTSGQLLQFSEVEPGGEFTVVESFGFQSESSPRMPNPVPVSRPVSALSFSSLASSSSTRAPKKAKFSIDPHQRSFDAVLNFISPALPEKAMLKLTVLVTTLSVPFLAVAPPSSLPVSSSLSHLEITDSQATKASRRHSTFSFLSLSKSTEGELPTEASPASPRSNRFTKLLRLPSKSIFIPDPSHHVRSAPPSPTHRRKLFSSGLHEPNGGRAHLVHVLPDMYSVQLLTSSPKPKLVQSIEQFLLSFAYRHQPLSRSPTLPRQDSSGSVSTCSSVSSRSSTYSNSNWVMRDFPEMEKPAPYMLPYKLLNHIPQQKEFSDDRPLNIIELILRGALDLDVPDVRMAVSEDGIRHSTILDGLLRNSISPRAWIGSPKDVKVRAELAPTTFEGSNEHSQNEFDLNLSEDDNGITFSTMRSPSTPLPVLVTGQDPVASGSTDAKSSANALLAVLSLPTPPSSSEGSGSTDSGGSGSSAEIEPVKEDALVGRMRAESAPTVPPGSKSTAQDIPPLPTINHRTRATSIHGDKASSTLRVGRQKARALLGRLRFWKNVLPSSS